MEKSPRPVRNRRHSRRAWPPGEIHRPVKRLFTPEIKRMLKDWLVRRRENPYPSREEKKALAIKTGLTYIQICNWFANWRRKLKNAGDEPQKKTWGHLIKNYNTSATGNVEQFSICSSDSIWEDEEKNSQFYVNEDSLKANECVYQRNYSETNLDLVGNIGNLLKKLPINDRKHNEYGTLRFDQFYPASVLNPSGIQSKSGFGYKISQEQCFQVTSTTNCNSYNKLTQPDSPGVKNSTPGYFTNAKYKNHIMEKYLRGLDCTNNNKNGLELSKWLESTANFTPNKNNYIEWDSRNKSSKKLPSENGNHQKEEIEAAEALTSLAGNYRNRMSNGV